MIPVKSWLVFLGMGLLLLANACLASREAEDSATEAADELDSGFTGIDLDQGGVPIACDQSYYPFETDFEVRQTPPLNEPDPRDPFQDPVFGTCIVRVTDRHADLSPEDPSAGIKNEYSRVQAFNADGRYLLARSVEAYWYLYDANTLQPLALLPLEVEPRWSSSDPDLIYYLSETGLMSLDIQSGVATRLHDLLGFDGGRPGLVGRRFPGV